MSGKDGKRLDIDQDLLIRIIGMEVWGIVIIPKHFDHDAKEFRDFRHEPIHALIRETRPRETCPRSVGIGSRNIVMQSAQDQALEFEMQPVTR